MNTAALGFVHRYRAGRVPDAPTILLLHGTGGTEDDLLPLADRLAPGAHVLSPRGKVLENGMPRFFRRLAEGVFDVEDVKVRAAELADFVRSAAQQYGFDAGRVVALGYSNGANIASAVMLLRPGALAGGVLLRAMVPLVPDPLPSLAGTRVLISNGEHDPLVAPAETQRLESLFRHAGAEVTLAWQHAGHGLMPADFARAREWLDGFFA